MATAADEVDGQRRVGDRRGDLRGEHLPAVDRAREDRLQRAVAVLGGDDVAGHERGDQRQEEGRQEGQHQHRGREPGLEDLRGEDRVGVARRVAADQLDDDEDQRQQHGEAETEVGALLGDELAQLPAVDGERRRPACALRDRGGRGGGRDAAHDASTSSPGAAHGGGITSKGIRKR